MSLLNALRKSMRMGGGFQSNFSHNNRKLTPGRKAFRMYESTASYRGKVNEKIRYLRKNLKDHKHCLKVFESKPAGYQVNHMEKKNHIEGMIRKLERQLEAV